MVLDDLSTGSLDNLARLQGNESFEFVRGSVMDAGSVVELLDGVDGVFHLAAAVGVKLIVESPVRTIETNVRGTEAVLEAAALRRVPVLITSTSEVYGKATKLPFSEEDDLVLGPTSKGRWAYACSKALDEFLGIAYFREKGLPVTIARLFNTVGPRQTGRYGMVMPTFVQQALAGRPLTVYGDGSQRRCFGYVGDVVGALCRLMERPEARGGVYNIGSQEEVSILELAQRVRARLGSASAIELIPYEEAYQSGFEDMTRRVPDITRIRELIGFEPVTRLDEIIDRIADYYRASD